MQSAPQYPSSIRLASSTVVNQLLQSQITPPEGASSLWSSSTFLPEQLIDKHLLHDADVSFYKKLGNSEINKVIELLGLRLVSLSRYSELQSASSEIRKSELELENFQLNKKIADDFNLVRDAEKIAKELAKTKSELMLSQAEV